MTGNVLDHLVIRVCLQSVLNCILHIHTQMWSLLLIDVKRLGCEGLYLTQYLNIYAIPLEL